jgi:NAD(P)-dependent dehydrogenase (short-subunit alcohol dehydrogenase family)
MEHGFRVDLSGQTIVVTGGTGVLGQTIVVALAAAGANLALIVRDEAKARRVFPATLIAEDRLQIVAGDVLDRPSLVAAHLSIMARFGRVDALVNGAGGNQVGATTSADHPFFDLAPEALRQVFDLNLMGTLLPSQIFGQQMATQGAGVIVNISSMNAVRPLTRIPAYSAAKAGVSNFTQWLAVHLAQEYSPRIRVNAIAPGFFLTEQNRFLLTDGATDALTPRGQAIMQHTPMGRFGDPGDLVGAVLWLLSSASAFVTGVVIPIDGGFSAWSGV